MKSLARNSMTPLDERLQNLRVALVHHWLVRTRGGEKVLAALCRLFPQADIFTLVYCPDGICETITSHRVTTSWIQKLPWATRHYGQYLPLLPVAIEQFDLSDYNLVISSDASVAKGVLTRPETCHICYCHSPMRYAWSAYHTYLDSVSSRWKRILMPFFLNYLRLWDVSAANRVDYFVANSQNVANRIQKYYRREASVIYPPVAVSSFPVSTQRQNYYLAVGQWVPYKRFDIAIAAFNELRRPLWVVGEGPEESRLNRRAQSHIRFLSRVSDSQLRTLISQCRALVFPGEEDFGMIIPETHACGRPAIALSRGGALETVMPGVNGVLFRVASAAALAAAVLHFESIESQFNPQEIRASAERFKEEQFFETMSAFVAEKLAEHRRRFSLESQKLKPSALVR
jgi:glycosyltransferase involved in cell wall biosynthesis